MCLLVPNMVDDKLIPLLTDSKPLSFLMTARDADEIARDKPEIAKLLREAVQRETVEVLGGEWSEVPSPLLPLESILHDIRRGRATYQRLFRKEPTTWARPPLRTASAAAADSHEERLLGSVSLLAR